MSQAEILIVLGVVMIPLGLALIILVGDYFGLMHVDLAFVIFGLIVSLGAGLITAGVVSRKAHPK
jgi:hypothetical protein